MLRQRSGYVNYDAICLPVRGAAENHIISVVVVSFPKDVLVQAPIPNRVF